MPTSESHQREAALFDAAMDLPPEQRAAYLDQACGEDTALRQRIESLLKASESQCGFLDPPTDPGLRPALHPTVPPIEKPGDRIGRYKLLQQIGEGGCGMVYMAEQEEPVFRRVALKVIKLGMDTQSVIARFEAERQALALMDHPNIAKVFDAGATETGRPYFVMELVRGIKITDFCDEKKLSPGARLDLFIQVCQAVQHAHQKGIIHRDLKPSNILVSVNDGRMVPKIIDFGIAKAASGQKLTDKTVFTAFEQFIGTPAYMSPEQAVLTNVDIDTRSDIYALGVLLYELLTGKTPFDPKELLSIGLDEMRRTIRETEPLRPSTRVSTLSGQELTTTAQRRGLEAPKLASELRGDLDWIVMKCLEKDRARRYETANGLAMDIQRHLENEPVVARPPSAVYRFRKLVRRNKLAFVAAGAIAGALLIGLSVSTWMFFAEKAARQRAVAAERDQMLLRQQADIARTNEATLRLQAQAAQRSEAALRVEAETARTNEAKLRLQAQAGEKKAETEAAKSRMVAQFLKDMLQSIRPSVALGRDTTVIREMLDQTAARVGQDLADQPEVQADLQTTIAEVYRAIGKGEQAERIQRGALATRQGARGRGDPEVARTLNNLALILQPEGEGTALDRWRDERRVMGAGILNDFEPAPSGPDASSEKERLAEVEWLHRQALAIRRETWGNENLETTESLNNFALVLRREGKLDEAEAHHREALACRRNILTGDRLPVAESLYNLAVVLRDAGKLAEAEEDFRKSLEMRRRLLGTADASVARTVHHLADVLERRSDVAGLESLFREELMNATSRSPNRPPLESDTVYQILDVLLAKKEYGRADGLVCDLLAPAIQKAPENVGLRRTRGEFFARRGRWSEAARDLARVIELDPDTHDPWYHLAPLWVRTGAINDYRRLCHDMLLRFGGVNPPLVAERTVKACLLLPPESRDLGLATELAQTAVVAGLDHPFVHYYQFAKGLAEYRQEHYARAEDWLRKSLAGDNNANLEILSRVVLAMTCHQLGKTNEARYALDDTLALVKPPWLSRSPDADDFTAIWWDVLISQILRDEAEALVGTDGTADGQPFPTFSEAVRLRQQGQAPQAEAALREVVTRYKALFGPDHPDTLGVQENLAVSYRTWGKPHLACPLFEETLKLGTASLGPDHPRTLGWRNDLAVAYWEAGRLNQALPLFEETLKLREAKLGPNHPDTLKSQGNLALAYEEARRRNRALPLLEETLKRMQVTLGPDHPDTLQAMGNLADGYISAGKHDQALPLCEETWKLRKARLGPDHPATLNAMGLVARGYLNTDKLDQALRLFQETLELMTAKLGPDHPDTLRARVNVAVTYREAGKLDQAIPVFEETLKLMKAKRGPDHPETRATTDALANLLARQGKWIQAADCFASLIQSNPTNHWNHRNLAPLLVASERLDVYRQHCRQAVERFGKTSDPFIAERIAKNCLILPDCGVGLDAVAHMADTAAATTNRGAIPWFQLVKGLVEYRQGRFASAVEWSNKTLTNTGQPVRDVEAYMVLAMAHYQFKQTDDARAALAKGVEIERTKLPKLERGDIGGLWLDWIIAHALMREAQALIEGRPETESPTR